MEQDGAAALRNVLQTVRGRAVHEGSIGMVTQTQAALDELKTLLNKRRAIGTYQRIVKQYAYHGDRCGIPRGDGPCDCGFDAALSEARALLRDDN